jgi:hypothetical protein
MGFTLSVRIVFGRAGNYQTAVLPSVNVPAAPVRFMNLIVGWRNQIEINYSSIQIELFFPGFDAPEPLLGIAKRLYLIPAE